MKGTLVKKEILPANGIPSEKSTVHLCFALCMWWVLLFCGVVTGVSCFWRGDCEPKLLVPLAIWWVSGSFLHLRSLLFPSSQIFYMQSKAGVVNSRQIQHPEWPAWKRMEYPRKAATSSSGIMEICQEAQRWWHCTSCQAGHPGRVRADPLIWWGHSLQPQCKCATELGWKVGSVWKLVLAEEMTFGLGENIEIDRSLRESCALLG